MDPINSIKYPRRNLIRAILKILAKIFVFLLIDVKVDGEENFPLKGPYIVIGNHVSALEPILMLIVTPQQLEYLGSGDIPIDPRMSFFSSLYKFVPIMRGQIDQKGLNSALSVLKQGGALGVFPEGGIWEKNLKEPKLGTSWLCHKSKAPIVPIGFVGMNGGLQKALTLKRPKVEVNIGKPIHYEEIFSPDASIKTNMVNGAQKIMNSVAELLPQEEIINPTQHKPRKLKFFLRSTDEGLLKEVIFENQIDFSTLIEHPVIMDVFKRNLKLKVDAFFKRGENIHTKDAMRGLDEMLNYLQANPGFLSYRFGIDQAINMKDGIKNLRLLIENSRDESQFLYIKIVY
jgi:1-acyl-sn-glycerol-3-phosphate acyltransferase